MSKMGRKSLRDETVQANVINLSWTTISRALNSKTLTVEEKRGNRGGRRHEKKVTKAIANRKLQQVRKGSLHLRMALQSQI